MEERIATMKEMYDAYVSGEEKLTPLDYVLIVLIAFLFGMLLGIFLSPKKHTVIGSNNGNNSPGCLTFDAYEEEDEVIED